MDFAFINILRTSFERFGDNSFLVSFPSELFNIFEMESRLLFGSLSLIDLDILSFIFLRNEDKDGLVSCLYPMLCASVRGGFC